MSARRIPPTTRGAGDYREFQLQLRAAAATTATTTTNTTTGTTATSCCLRCFAICTGYLRAATKSLNHIFFYARGPRVGTPPDATMACSTQRILAAPSNRCLRCPPFSQQQRNRDPRRRAAQAQRQCRLTCKWNARPNGELPASNRRPARQECG